MVNDNGVDWADILKKKLRKRIEEEKKGKPMTEDEVRDKMDLGHSRQGWA